MKGMPIVGLQSGMLIGGDYLIAGLFCTTFQKTVLLAARLENEIGHVMKLSGLIGGEARIPGGSESTDGHHHQFALQEQGGFRAPFPPFPPFHPFPIP